MNYLRDFWLQCVCVSGIQHISSSERPGVDELFEPVSSVTLLEQRWQNNLKQQQFQRQLADRGIAADKKPQNH